MKKLFLYFIFLLLTLNANFLNNATSPYLLQHKDNPVNWYSWTDEALQKAQKENKLIFLSIGYSTCHWCHVMAYESFEDKEVAKVLNQNYVSIKIDREELPHIDEFYQKVYKTMNNKSGGWPLTLMMTPELEPFFSATYVPKYAGYGSRGLLEILEEFNTKDLQELKEEGKSVLESIQNIEKRIPSLKKYDINILTKSLNEFKTIYDKKYKGFAINPKFPEFAKIIMLLKIYNINQDKEVLQMALEPLRTMAKGGIYDQIEGGFYRYAVDERWLLPHFEKMLYTNSEALEAYTLAYEITKEPLFKKVISETMQEMDNRFKVDGVYKSASNADSKNFEGEKEEGFYFMVEYDYAFEYMKKNQMNVKDIEEVLKYLGIVSDGTFDGDLSNPEITHGIKPKALGRGMELLKEMRKLKEYPFIDNKINTAWNALHLKGLLIASRIDYRYQINGLNSLDTLVEKMYIDGVLYHQTIGNKKPSQKALLEDYAFLSSALFKAYQITLDKKYMKLFKTMIKDSIELFYKNGHWYNSNDGFDSYADIKDKGYASALGVHFNNLILYASMEGDIKLFKIIQDSMQYFVERIDIKPIASPNATLASLFFSIEPVFIKSTKNNLEKIDMKQINYPFVYKRVNETQEYLGCKLNSCFSYSKNLDRVVEAINKLQ
jgi:uncharacterized protein YyaL (SSP411 family)